MVSSVAFAYISFWLIVTVCEPCFFFLFGCFVCFAANVDSTNINCWQPFIDQNQFIQEFFPARYFGLAIPALLLVGALTVLTTFLGLVVIKSA